MSRRDGSRLRRVVPVAAGVGVAGLLVLALIIWREPLWRLFTEPGNLADAIARLGALGPLALIGLQMAQVIAAPIPGQVVGLASGYLYGAVLGTVYSMIGLMLGTYLALWLAHRWGRPLIERLLDAQTLARVDRVSERLGVPLLFLVFLLPFLPDDAILLVAGLTDIPLAGALLAALLGRLPGVLVSAWIGANAGELSPIQWAAVIAVTLAVAIPLYVWRAALERRMWSFIERLTGRV